MSKGKGTEKAIELRWKTNPLGQTTITRRIPYSLQMVMWVLYCPLPNHEREDAGDKIYGIHLSKKTRKSNLLQMTQQR